MKFSAQACLTWRTQGRHHVLRLIQNSDTRTDLLNQHHVDEVAGKSSDGPID